MMPAFAQVQRQIYIHRAARTGEERGLGPVDARSVRRQQQRGRKFLTMLATNFFQSGRTDFLARFHQENRIEI